MRIGALIAATVLSSNALADSCAVIEGSMIVNSCRNCLEVTLRELRPRAEQGVEIFTGEPRSVRVEAGSRVTVQGGERYAITNLQECP
jgi:hypothetical protein